MAQRSQGRQVNQMVNGGVWCNNIPLFHKNMKKTWKFIRKETQHYVIIFPDGDQNMYQHCR